MKPDMDWFGRSERPAATAATATTSPTATSGSSTSLRDTGGKQKGILWCAPQIPTRIATPMNQAIFFKGSRGSLCLRLVWRGVTSSEGMEAGLVRQDC